MARSLRICAGKALASLSLLFPCSGAAQTVQNIVVTSAASFELGLPPNGSIGSIFCTGLNVQGIVKARGVPLPFSLAGVTVAVGGASAPLFAVAAGPGYQLINFQVPQETQIDSNGAAEIVVRQNGASGSARATLSKRPGDFFRLTGDAYGIFRHGAGLSLVTKQNPAKPGELLVVYLTGLPGTNPIVPTGQPAPAQPLAWVPQSLVMFAAGGFYDAYKIIVNDTFEVGDTANSFASGDFSQMPFIGLTPGSVGLYQINFILPAGVPAGDAQIKLENQFCAALSICGASGTIQKTHSSPVLLPVD